jgi:antitoxin component YwqK of YwqJK toxin-antitoxin module
MRYWPYAKTLCGIKLDCKKHMRQFLIIISIFLTQSNISAQIDELKLFPNFILYKNDTLSCYDKNGLKQGKWIEYKIKNILWVITPDSCNIDNISPEGVRHVKSHWSDWRFVSETYSRTKSKIDSNCDTVYSNVIPPVVIEFLNFGDYLDNKKTGKWKTYDKDELLYKEFLYDNGLAIDKFYFYYQNGFVKMEGVINRNEDSFGIKKFSDSGELIEEKTYNLNELNNLL